MIENITQINIELSSHCNLKCAGCTNSTMRRPKGHMTLSTLKKILESPELSDLQTVYFWLYGEPLLNPHFMELTEFIEGRSFQKILSTNGSLLNNYDELSYLNSYDEIIISINGVTEKVYEIIHGKNALMTVIRGLEKYNRVRNNILTMQFVASKINIEQMDDTIAFAKLRGFDRLVIKSFNVMDQRLDTFNKYVPMGKNSRYIEFNKPISGSYDYNIPCHEKLAMTWEGNVLPCCFDYYGDNVLGHIANDSISSILTLKARKHNQFNFCNDCTSHKIIKSIDIKNA